MNAIFSVCHFCEQHGPRIVMCTQSFSAPPKLDDYMLGRAQSGSESYYVPEASLQGSDPRYSPSGSR